MFLCFRYSRYSRFILKLYINDFPNLFSFVYLFITLLFWNVVRFIQKPIWSQSCELEVHKNMARLFLQIGLAYFQKDIFFPHYISILYQNIMKIHQVPCVILCVSEVFIWYVNLTKSNWNNSCIGIRIIQVSAKKETIYCGQMYWIDERLSQKSDHGVVRNYLILFWQKHVQLLDNPFHIYFKCFF